MTEPRRRYTKREKASAVTAAMASSVQAAAEQKGIPRTTIDYWMDHPEFVELRKKTREEMAEGSMVLANLAQSELARKVKAGEVEPRDLAVIYGIAIDKAQLMAGQATSRNESRDITKDDHESEILRDAIHRELTERGQRAAATAGADKAAVADNKA